MTKKQPAKIAEALFKATPPAVKALQKQAQKELRQRAREDYARTNLPSN